MPEENPAAEKSHLRCKVIIEMLGKPKEHVQKTIQMYVDKIKTDPDLIVINNDFADATQKEDMWSTFTELDIIIKGIPKLIDFCFNYMPSSIEIIKPEEFFMKKSVIENLINDLQARLHNVDMVVKKQKNENEFLRKNMGIAICNSILISLASKSLDKETLSKATGVPDQELDAILTKLLNEKKIVKENNLYSLAK
jgi:hypothetical protein